MRDLLERLEDGRLVHHGDANAGVRDAHAHLVARRVRAHGDPAARRRELHGIRHQVDDDLRDPALVGRRLRKIGFDVERQRLCASARLLADEHQRFFQDPVERDGLGLELHATCLDLRDVEHVVDEGQEVPAGVEDVLQVLLLLRVHLAEQTVEQHLREADDCVQRRPQLVRHVSEELGFVLARDLQLAVLFVDRLEELRTRDRDRSLRREGRDELDLRVLERVDRVPPQEDDTRRHAATQHRHAEKRAEVAKPLSFGERVVAVRENVGHLNRPALERHPSHDRVNPRTDRHSRHVLVVGVGPADRAGEPVSITVEAPDLTGVRPTKRHRIPNHGVEHESQIERRSSDYLQHLDGRRVLAHYLCQLTLERPNPRREVRLSVHRTSLSPQSAQWQLHRRSIPGGGVAA